MSYSPGIGLVLGLGLDTSGVAPGLQDFDQQLDDATEKWNHDWEESTKSVDKGLISNRETARLLSQELGIHLPRAVTKALGEMLPAIGLLGPALLGAFAGEEIVKFAEHAKKAADAVNEIAQSEKLVKEIGEENVKAMEAMAKKSVEYAHTQLALLNAQIVAGEADVERLKRHAEGLDSNLAALIPLLNAYHFYMGQSKDLKTAEQGLDEQLKLRDSLVKILGDDMAKANKEAAKGVEEAGNAAEEAYRANQKAFHAAEEALRRQFEMQNRVGHAAVEEARKEEEAKERAARATAHLTEELHKQELQHERLVQELSKETEHQIADIERVGNEQERQAERGKNEARQRIEDQHNQAVAAIQAHQQEADAIARLNGDYKAMAQAGIAAYQALIQADLNYTKQLVAQHKEEQKAATEATNAEIAGIGALAEGAAQLADSKKAYYAVKAAEEVAAGVEALAEGTWPPNPQAIIAAGLHFESAAEYAKLAGTSAGHRGAGATGAGSEYGAPGGGDQYRSGGGGGGGEQGPELPGTGPSSERAGVTINMPIYGHVFADNLQTLANKLGQGIQNGTIKAFPATQSPVTKGLL